MSRLSATDTQSYVLTVTEKLCGIDKTFNAWGEIEVEVNRPFYFSLYNPKRSLMKNIL